MNQEPNKHQQKMRVLIIEDDPLTRQLMQEWVALRSELELITLVDNGMMALQYFQSLPRPCIDLIFLDIHMPQMSGIDFLERLSDFSELADLPQVIFTTAHVQYAVNAFDLGAIDFLLKPISLQRFHKAVDRCLYIKRNHIPLDFFPAIRSLTNISKYERSSLTEEEAEKYILKINKILQEDKIFLDPELSFQQLAKAVGIRPHTLSIVINTYLKRNFYTLLSEYRVKEARDKLDDPAWDHRKIIDIALESGFGTKSAFNRAFKHVTGKTPRIYRDSRCGY